VAPLRHAVAALACELGLGAERVEDVALAVSEACSNVVVHAYRASEPGEIRVDAHAERGALRVEVADDGVGCTPRADSPGLGLGLGIVELLADDLRVEPGHPRGTVLTMRFDLAPAAAQ
jgi:anti-sigma regulatory factor (Ser/Thr protein kinase)